MRLAEILDWKGLKVQSTSEPGQLRE